MSVTHRLATDWTGREDPEDGDEALRIHHLQAAKSDRKILGFACEAGVARNKGRTGAKEAPVTIRKAMAGLSAPQSADVFTDLGDVVVDSDALEEGQAFLADHIADALNTGGHVVVLGGGHETAFGSFMGLQQAFPGKKIGIINLDAHLDLRNPGQAGPSSGTPFNQIRELAPDTFDYLCLGVAEEANSQALLERAQDWGVGVVSDHALIKSPEAADAHIQAMAQRSDILYLTIDIDVLPHFQAPGVSAPAVRGVPFETVERLVDQCLIACQGHGAFMPLADIVEVSPRFDRDGVTAKTAAYLGRKLLFR